MKYQMCYLQGEETAEIKSLQEKLTSLLIGLVRATVGNDDLVTEETDRILMEGLFATMPNVEFDSTTIESIIQKAEDEKRRLVPNCYYCSASCGKNDNYDMKELENADEEIRSLKTLLLFTARNVAAFGYHADKQGQRDEKACRFLHKALFAIGMKDWGKEILVPIVVEGGKIVWEKSL